MRPHAPRAVLSRAAGLAAAAGLLCFGLGAPAHAADPIPVEITGTDRVDLSLQGQDDGGEPQVSLRLRPPGPPFEGEGNVPVVHRGDFSVRIDATSLKGVADVKLPCGAEGLVAVCDAYELYQGEVYNRVGDLRFDISEDSAAGDFGTVKVTGEGAGLEFVPLDIDVLVGGPEFANRKLTEPKGFRAGDTYESPLGFRNKGAMASDGTVLRVWGSRGLGFAEKYSNCQYDENFDGPLLRQGSEAICTFEGSYAPGKAYAVAEPFGVTTKDFALFDVLSYSFAAVSPDKAAGLRTGDGYRAGDGPELRLAEVKGADPANYTRWAELDLPTTNTYDLELTGDTVYAEEGETVNARIGFANKGPGWISAQRSGGEPIRFTVEIPEGTEVAEAPSTCRPMGDGTPTYRCYVATPLLEDAQLDLHFGLHVTKKITGAKGRIALPEFENPAEPNTGNNSAWLVVNPKDGTDPGGGDTAGSGEGKGEDGEPGTGSADGKGGKDGQGATGADGAASGSSGGLLASTGAEGIFLIAGAAALAAAGGVFLVRRRSSGGSAV